MIGFLDSGIGGLTIAAHCSEILKSHQIVYLCDRQNLPYGNKTKNELCKIVFDSCKNLKNMGCKIIVLACNTATSCAISFVRKRIPEILIIGTEPNVLGAFRDGKKEILVLATKVTVKYNRLLKEYKEKLTVFSPDNLASQIENGEELNLKETFAKLPNKNYDAVIIGCTHYSIIKKELQSFFKNAVFYESGQGVARRLKNLCEKTEIIKTK